MPYEVHEAAHPGRTGVHGAKLRKTDERERARNERGVAGAHSGRSYLKCPFEHIWKFEYLEKPIKVL